MNHFVLILFWFWPMSAKALIVLQPTDANDTLINDSFRGDESISSRSDQMSVGDFNGDGLDDVAILMGTKLPPSSPTHSIELFLAPFEKEASFLSKPHCTLFLDDSRLELHSEKMADLNGDGRDDLVVRRRATGMTSEQIQIVFGEKDPPTVMDLGLGPAPLNIIPPQGFLYGGLTVGNFNGDGAKDFAVLFSSDPVSYVYFLVGGDGFPSGTVDLSISNPFGRVSFPGEGMNLVPGDFNGDLRDDLAIGSYQGTSYGVFVFFGRPILSGGGPDLLTNVEMIGYYRDLGIWVQDLFLISAGDMTGDHRDELIVQGNTSSNSQWVVSGEAIDSGQPILRQRPGFSESVPFYPIPPINWTPGWASFPADFDGDGADDLFSFSPLHKGMGGLLTTDFHPGGISLDNLNPESSLGWVVVPEVFRFGDFNGDGFQDIATYEDFKSVYPPYGALRFLYGFRPLKNPRITAQVETADSLRLTFALSVDGNPTEMVFSGDVSAEFKEIWIPFRTTQEVVLSPGGGAKTVRVRFKNAVGRESDTAETAVTVSVTNSRVRTETNRLRPGGRVSFDCHLQNAGELRARVYGPQGNEVIEVENRHVESGIYPVQWDGRNAHGNRVAPGVYYLVIEADGERTKKEILVE